MIEIIQWPLGFATFVSATRPDPMSVSLPLIIVLLMFVMSSFLLYNLFVMSSFLLQVECVGIEA